MRARAAILAGMAAGVAWAVGVVSVGRVVPVPIGLIQPVLLGAVFAPGLVLVAMIGRLAQRRFFDTVHRDGGAFAPGSGGDIDHRVLWNTAEQIVLALCIWPLAGFTLGAGVPLVLGLAFAVARLAFWWGYHLAPPLRAFGFAATFYPTVLAAVLTLYELAV